MLFCKDFRCKKYIYLLKAKFVLVKENIWYSLGQFNTTKQCFKMWQFSLQDWNIIIFFITLALYRRCDQNVAAAWVLSLRKMLLVILAWNISVTRSVAICQCCSVPCSPAGGIHDHWSTVGYRNLFLFYFNTVAPFITRHMDEANYLFHL